MPQPRSQQIKNVKTKHSLPNISNINGTAPTQLATSTTIINTLGQSSYDLFLAQTVTGSPSGCEQDSPAYLIGTTQEPYVVSAGNTVSITIPGVNGGSPITVTFQNIDLVLIGGASRLTASRAAARINATIAGLGYATPVASNNNGFLQITSGTFTGSTSSATLSEGTPGIVAALGFGSAPSITATGSSAATRGVLTVTPDNKGGYLPLRYLDSSSVVTQGGTFLSYGNRFYQPAWNPGSEIYGKITWTPGATLGGIKFTINTYAVGANPLPSIVTTQSNFSAIAPGASITIAVSGIGGVVSVPVTFPAVTTRQDVITAINQAWHTATNGSGDGAGRAIVTATIPEPYHFDAGDNFSVFLNGGGLVSITPVGVSAADVAASINSQLGAGATCVAYTDVTGISYVQIRSTSIDGTASAVIVAPFTSGTSATDKLGIAFGSYLGSAMALPYGGCEVTIRSIGATGMQITGTTTVLGQLGLPTAGVTVTPVTKEDSVPIPFGGPGSIHYLLPEVMEFGEVPQNTDDVIQQFLTPNSIRQWNPGIGSGNQGLLPIVGQDGRLPPGMMPALLSFLSMNKMTLGATKLGTNTDALTPRISTPFSANVGVTYTLLWESVAAGGPGPNSSLRLYGEIGGTLVFTVNARWDGANWNKDQAAISGQKIAAASGKFQIFTFPASSAGPWDDHSWGEIPLEVNDPSIFASRGMVRLGQRGLLSATDAAVARLNIPYADSPAAYTLLNESKPFSLSGPVSRIYSDGRGGTIQTWNAGWDGVNWNKDQTGACAKAIFESFIGGSKESFDTVHQYRNPTNNAPWDDTAWDTVPYNFQDQIPSLGTPAILSLLGIFQMGTDGFGSNISPDLPRLSSNSVTTGGTLRTLLWKSAGTNFAIRLYHSIDDNFEFVLNASFNNTTSLWTRENAAYPATRIYFGATGAGVRIQIRPVGSTNWGGSWGGSNITISSPGVSGLGSINIAQQGVQILADPGFEPGGIPAIDTIYSINIPKCWVNLKAGSTTVGNVIKINSFNVGTPSLSSPNILLIPFLTPMLNDKYAVTFGTDAGASAFIPSVVGKTANDVSIQMLFFSSPNFLLYNFTSQADVHIYMNIMSDQ